MAWQRKGADQGYVRAEFKLGIMYDAGQGVPEGYAAAMDAVPQGGRTGLLLPSDLRPSSEFHVHGRAKSDRIPLGVDFDVTTDPSIDQVLTVGAAVPGSRPFGVNRSLGAFTRGEQAALIVQISSRLPAGLLCRRASESGLYVGYAPRLTR